MEGFGLVLGVSDKAVVRWMLDFHYTGAHKWWTFRENTPDSPAWGVDALGAPSCWHVHEVQLVTPDSLGADAHGLVLAQHGDRTGLLAHAARNGFHHLSVHFLRKLREVLDLKFKRGATPKTEMEWVRSLSEAVLGTVTPEMWKHMCDMRSKDSEKAELMAESLLAHTGNEEALQRSLHGLDLSESVADLKATLKQRATSTSAASKPPAAPPATATAETGAASSSSAPSAPTIGPRKPVNIEYEVHDTITLEEARALLPQSGKYGLVKNIVLHMRWQSKFKDHDGNMRYFSKGWGPRGGHTVRSSLAHVLQQVWSHHTELTGEEPTVNIRLAE